VGKISAFLAATQTTDAKKKRKRTRSEVSADTTAIRSDVKTIDVDDEGGDIESPKAIAASSARTPRKAALPGKQAVETPRHAPKTQERPRSSTDLVGDLGRTRG
jgi:hypothetical protein